MPDNSIDALVTDPPAGIAFMGKDWDTDKGGRKEWVRWMESVMRECLRVLKPGAHGLVWAIPRTSHWTAMAIEWAGFEICDCVYWLYGHGFPKSLNVSKSIDKSAGLKGELLGHKDAGLDKTGGSGFKFKNSNGRDETGLLPVHAPASPASKQWAGWGTALKPAAECWWLVQKPQSEANVAENVLRWGTGALNIDGCRVGESGGTTGLNYEKTGLFGIGGKADIIDIGKGRYPSNMIVDEATSAQLDRSNPGAARYFYCAKTSTEERNRGLGEVESKHPTVKPLKLMGYLCRLITPPGGRVLDCFMGSGSTGVAALAEGFEFVGVEREKEYFVIARARLGQSDGMPNGKSGTSTTPRKDRRAPPQERDLGDS